MRHLQIKKECSLDVIPVACFGAYRKLRAQVLSSVVEIPASQKIRAGMTGIKASGVTPKQEEFI